MLQQLRVTLECGEVVAVGVTVRLRLEDRTTQERSLVVRNGLKMGVVWRERVAVQ